MYDDPDPKGSRMRENAQKIICQKYLRSMSVRDLVKHLTKAGQHE
jgi:hypothetical protein